MATEKQIKRRATRAPSDTETDRDYAYYPFPEAHLYTTARLYGKTTTRFYVSILISPTHSNFELALSGRRISCSAAVLKPLIASGKGMNDGRLVTVHLVPSHPEFRRFCALPAPGILKMDRRRFAPLDCELKSACEGTLSLDGSARLINEVVARVLPLIPARRPSDSRVAILRDLVQSEPNCTLSHLASALDLSYGRTSHLFTEAIGLPFRSYQLWLKVRRANRLLWAGQSLTDAAHEAGFADSPHLCRTYQKVFGHPPSYYFDNKLVKIIAPAPIRTEASATQSPKRSAATDRPDSISRSTASPAMSS